MAKEELIFYPKHPSEMKTQKIETSPMPELPQEEPFDVKNCTRNIRQTQMLSWESMWISGLK